MLVEHALNLKEEVTFDVDTRQLLLPATNWRDREHKVWSHCTPALKFTKSQTLVVSIGFLQGYLVSSLLFIVNNSMNR